MVFLFNLAILTMADYCVSSSAETFRGLERNMRIYYVKKGLRGKPYSSASINADVFTKLRMGGIHYPGYDSLMAVGGFPIVGADIGEYTDYEYTSSEGVFYIPQSICMGEEVAHRVNDYYFVVLYGNEVELRYLRRDFNEEWHETVGRDEPVTDPEIIAKMERTMTLFVEADRGKEPESAKVSLPEKALLDFLELLGVQKTKHLAAQIQSAAANPVKFYADNASRLKNEFGFKNAYTGWHLDMLLMTLERQGHMERVDWKEAAEEVSAHLLDLLPRGAEKKLPDYRDSEADAVQVLHECNSVLDKEYGLTALLWDTGGDEYAFIVIPTAKIAEAFTLARQLGVDLQYVEEQWK